MPPAAIMAGVTVGGALLDRFANRKTSGEKAMEVTAQKQGALADRVGSFAQGQHNLAQPALQKAMDYYTKLATGGNAGIQSALAPDMNNLASVYRGAEHGMNRSMAAGPQRDRAIAEMQRQKAGQMGIMGFEARQNAFGQMSDMGQNISRTALAGYGAQGNILQDSNKTNDALAGAQNQRQQWISKMGAGLTDVFMPYLRGMGGKTPLPSTQHRTGGSRTQLPGPIGGSSW